MEDLDYFCCCDCGDYVIEPGGWSDQYHGVLCDRCARPINEAQRLHEENDRKMSIQVGDKLTSDCGGCGLIGKMVVTKIVAADTELDVFNAGDLVYVTETLTDETGIIRTYETFFNASKLVDGVLTFNDWQWKATAPAITINLLEDNAGGLFIGNESAGWWDVTPGQFTATFDDDSTALATGDTSDWTIDHYDDEPKAEYIATWDNGSIAIVGKPGIAAKNYLRLEA